jgi:hypothetical protein
MLTADELLSGAGVTHDVELPPELLGASSTERSVRLRPLTVKDLQVVARAARDNDALASVLMVKAALISPELTLHQANALPVGVLQYLLEHINRISGIDLDSGAAERAAEDPLVRAAFLLSQAFGWTPEQVSDLTLGQILLHLELLKQRTASS